MRPWRDHLEPDDPLVAEDGPGARGLTASRHAAARSGSTGGPPSPRPGCGTRAAGGGRRGSSTRPPAGPPAACGPPVSSRATGWCGRTGSSVDALVAHVGALRAGLVVVPANTAYSSPGAGPHRDATCGPSAAVVGSARAGRLGRGTAARGPLVVTGPALDLPDGDPGPLDAARSRRPGPHLLHLGDDRCAQGGGAASPEPAGRRPSRSPGPGG